MNNSSEIGCVTASELSFDGGKQQNNNTYELYFQHCILNGHVDYHSTCKWLPFVCVNQRPSKMLLFAFRPLGKINERSRFHHWSFD